MEVLGVIAESYISFKITWTNPADGSQPKFDQNNQTIEIHETDIYPDLEYTSASAEVLYLKYTAGSKLADLMVAINAVISAKLKKDKESTNEAALPASKEVKGLPAPDEVKGLLASPEVKGLPAPPETKGLPPSSPDPNKIKVDNTNQRIKPNELDVKPDEPVKESDDLAGYTVTVYGDRLRLIDGQSSEGGPGIKIVYRISENLHKEVDGQIYDNTEKIWAEVRSGLASYKIKFEEFEEAGKDPRFAGNLLAQILPTVILEFIPNPTSSYSRKGIEDKLVDLISSTNITLLGKTEAERVNILKAVASSLPGVDLPTLLSKAQTKPEEKEKPKK